MPANVNIYGYQLDLDGVSISLSNAEWADPKVVLIVRNDVGPSQVQYVFSYRAARATLTAADAQLCSAQLGIVIQ